MANTKKRISQAILDEIRERVSALEVGKALGLRISSSGRCPCPFHNGEDDNLQLYDNRNGAGFYCFVCNKAGDIFALTQEVLSINFPDAVRWINDTFGLQLTIDSAAGTESKEASEAEYLSYVLLDSYIAVKHSATELKEIAMGIRQYIGKLASTEEHLNDLAGKISPYIFDDNAPDGEYPKAISDQLEALISEPIPQAADDAETNIPAQPSKEEQ